MQRGVVVVHHRLRRLPHGRAGVVEQHDGVVGHPRAVVGGASGPVGVHQPHRLAGDHHPRGECGLGRRRNPCPRGEHVVVGVLDPLEDARVQHPRRRHAPPRRRRQRRDAVVGLAVEPPVALDLEGHQRAPLRGDDPGVRVGAEPAQVLLGHVDAAPVEVLADVAQEVGELEGEAERAGRRDGIRAGSQDRQHHLADDGGAAVHVAQQVAPGLVGAAGEVGAHRAEEAREALLVDVALAHRRHDGRHDRVGGGAGGQGVPERALEGVERERGLRAGVGAGEVDDVVGEPGQRVDGVDVPAALGGQQAGAPVVGRAVLAGDRGAAGIAGGEHLGRCDRGDWVHRTTVRGTGRAAPAYSCTRCGRELAAHQHHRDADPGLGARAGEHQAGHPAVDVRRAERPGLQERVGQGERRAEVHALGAPVVGGDEQLLADVGGVAAGLEEGVQPLAHRAGLARPVEPGTGVRHRLQHVHGRGAGGSGGRVGDRRHGDQARRVGHQLAAVDDRLERAVPVGAEVDVVVAQVRPGRARGAPRATRRPRARSRRCAPRGARRHRAAGGRRPRAGRGCTRRRRRRPAHRRRWRPRPRRRRSAGGSRSPRRPGARAPRRRSRACAIPRGTACMPPSG